MLDLLRSIMPLRGWVMLAMNLALLAFLYRQVVAEEPEGPRR